MKACHSIVPTRPNGPDRRTSGSTGANRWTRHALHSATTDNPQNHGTTENDRWIRAEVFSFEDPKFLCVGQDEHGEGRFSVHQLQAHDRPLGTAIEKVSAELS